MPIWIFIDVQYLRNVVFSFEKSSKDIDRNSQLGLFWHSWACPKYFKMINKLQNVFWLISRETANCFRDLSYMWSGTSGYVLDQSDNRIHKTAISLEWVEGWNCFFRQIYLKEQPFDSNNGSAQKCPDTFKSTHKVLSKWGVCIICLKSWWRYEIEISYMVGIYRCNMRIQDMSQTI